MLLGPLSLLLLSKPAEPGSARWTCWIRCWRPTPSCSRRCITPVPDWVQLDEPVLAADRTGQELEALERSYQRLGSLTARPAIMVATYFGEIGAALPVLAASPVEAIGLDFVAGPGNREALAQAGGIGGKTLVAGVIDGRNVWRADLAGALSMCASLLGLAGQLAVSTSCSLLHVPLDLSAEKSLPAELAGRLAFARQKVDEVVTLGRALSDGRDVLAEVATLPRPAVNGRVRARLEALGEPHRAPGLRHPARRAGRRPAGPADDHDRVVPADRGDPQGPRGPQRGPDQRRRLHGRDARRDRPGHRPAGRHRPGRPGARRARAQRHGAVLRRAAGRVRRHRARLGAVLRHPLRAPAHPARRRRPARIR